MLMFIYTCKVQPEWLTGNFGGNRCPERFPVHRHLVSSIYTRCYPVLQLHGCAFTLPPDTRNIHKTLLTAKAIASTESTYHHAWLQLLLRIFLSANSTIVNYITEENISQVRQSVFIFFFNIDCKLSCHLHPSGADTHFCYFSVQMMFSWFLFQCQVWKMTQVCVCYCPDNKYTHMIVTSIFPKGQKYTVKTKVDPGSHKKPKGMMKNLTQSRCATLLMYIRVFECARVCLTCIITSF